MLKKSQFTIFLISILVSFIALNIAISLLSGPLTLDTSADLRYSLSPQTQKWLKQNSQNIYIRLYLSPDIYQNRHLKEYSQDVLRLLEQYQQNSDQHISIKTIEITPFSPSVAEAQKLGVRNNGKDSAIALVLSDEDGNFVTIPYLDYHRRAYLEHDIGRAISKLNHYNKPIVGILSTDYKIISTGDSLDYTTDWPFAEALRQDYELRYIASDVAFIPQDIDVLLVANPKDIANITVYGIEQYLIRGGSVAIFLDPLSEVTMKLNGIQSNTTGLRGLLKHHGITFAENKIVGDALQNRPIIKNNKTSEYPFWIYAIPNTQHTITSDISHILLNSSGFLEIDTNHSPQIQTLLSTSNQSGEIDVSYLKNSSIAQAVKNFNSDNKSRILAVLSEGNFKAYYSEPPLNTPQYMDGIHSYRSLSTAPGKLMVVADSDILDAAHWNANSANNQEPYEYVPYSGNYDFIERAIDYLSNNEKMLNIPPKTSHIQSTPIATILYQKAVAKYEKQMSNLLVLQEEILQEQAQLFQKIKDNELLASVSTARKLEELERKKIDTIQNQRILNAKINSTYNMYMIIFTFINLIIPILMLIIFVYICKYSLQSLTKNIERLKNDA